MVTVPYGTDTAIYYWPYATVALIIVNCLAFGVQSAIPDRSIDFDDGRGGELRELAFEFGIDTEPGWVDFALALGSGIHPFQWLTSAFLHAGIGHLIGNMIFLWAFGIVVEGKVGPLIFTTFYLVIAILQSAAVQLMMLGGDYGIALGASGAIYGLLAASMIFAPKDNLLMFTGIYFFFFTYGIPILMFALFYILWDFGLSLFTGFGISTPMLHTMGAIVGFGCAIWLLNMRYVRVDDNDIFSLLHEARTGEKKKRALSHQEKAERKEAKEQLKLQRDESLRVGWKSFDTHFSAGNIDAAINVVLHMKRKDPGQQWKEDRLLKVIQHYVNEKQWNKVCHYSTEYLAGFTGRSNAIRLNLARIYLAHHDKPRKAIKILQGVNPQELDAKSNEIARKLVTRAKKMIEDGTIEFSDE